MSRRVVAASGADAEPQAGASAMIPVVHREKSPKRGRLAAARSDVGDQRPLVARGLLSLSGSLRQ